MRNHRLYRFKKSITQIIFLVSGFWFLVSLLVGCVGIQKRDLPEGTPPLETAAFLKFIDVPVPVGFKFLAEKSCFFESGPLRAGLLRYTGKAIGDQIVNFYKEQMPMYGWFLLNVVEYGDRTLNFEKANESCIIIIRPVGSKSDLTISVSPKPSPIERRVEKKAERPIK